MRMKEVLRSTIHCLMLIVVMGVANAAFGQAYPARPIRIIAADPGSSNDVLIRDIGNGISGPLGQAVIIENHPPTLTPDIAARANPDGYTFAFGGSAIWITPLLQQTNYDPVKDFTGVSLVGIYTSIMVVNSSLPVKSVGELIALAKSHPGELNYSQGPPGGGVHLSEALFSAMAGVNIVFVPYTGAAQGLNATLANQTQIMIWNAQPMLPQVKAGKLRALAVTSTRPSPLVPDLPTMAASGVPGYESISIIGLLAPSKAPSDAITRVNQEVVRFLSKPDVREKFAKTGLEVVGSSPAEFSAKIKSEIAKWGKVIKDAGIKVNP